MTTVHRIVTEHATIDLEQEKDGALRLGLDRGGVAGVSSIVTSEQLYELAEKAEAAESSFTPDEPAP